MKPRPVPSEEDLSSSRVFQERGRTNSARWFLVDGQVFHSRAAGHLEESIHSPEYVASTHHLEEVTEP